jgi:hypothetical protein
MDPRPQARREAFQLTAEADLAARVPIKAPAKVELKKRHLHRTTRNAG